MWSDRGKRLVVALVFALAASPLCCAQELPGDLLGVTESEIGGYCQCSVPGCECNVEFKDLAAYP